MGDFATRIEMPVVNTHFKKRAEHRVTYRSGGGVREWTISNVGGAYLRLQSDIGGE